MAVYRVSRVIPVASKTMLSVIGNVAKYPQFVPFCIGSKVTEQATGVPSRATLQVGWNSFNDNFESELSYGDGTVRARAADSSMFEKLECNWTVKPINPQKCSTTLNLEFQFASSLYNAVSGQAGPSVAKKMIAAFEARARAVESGAS